MERVKYFIAIKDFVPTKDQLENSPIKLHTYQNPDLNTPLLYGCKYTMPEFGSITNFVKNFAEMMKESFGCWDNSVKVLVGTAETDSTYSSFEEFRVESTSRVVSNNFFLEDPRFKKYKNSYAHDSILEGASTSFCHAMYNIEEVLLANPIARRLLTTHNYVWSVIAPNRFEYGDIKNGPSQVCGLEYPGFLEYALFINLLMHLRTSGKLYVAYYRKEGKKLFYATREEFVRDSSFKVFPYLTSENGITLGLTKCDTLADLVRLVEDVKEKLIEGLQKGVEFEGFYGWTDEREECNATSMAWMLETTIYNDLEAVECKEVMEETTFLCTHIAEESTSSVDGQWNFIDYVTQVKASSHEEAARKFATTLFRFCDETFVVLVTQCPLTNETSYTLTENTPGAKVFKLTNPLAIEEVVT